jgi:S1-C subfamily serine protease
MAEFNRYSLAIRLTVITIPTLISYLSREVFNVLLKIIPRAVSFRFLACLGACLLCAGSAQAQATNQAQSPSGGARAGDPRFRLIRSVSGTKIHEESGRFEVEDARSVFYVPADKEVVVYFTWEGPAGKHHFEGVWHDPSGKVTLISVFDYEANATRFGGYFKLLLSEAQPGGWLVEARIDGESAGAHAFQVVAAELPNNVVSTRRVISRADIYSKAAAATIVIENIDQKGARRNVGSGFLISPGHLLTAFEVIDGATKVRVVGPQGKLIEVTDVLAWNRRQDWAILSVPSDSTAVLPRAADSLSIGDRCYLLDVPAEGNRVLIETSLIGKQSLQQAGERLNIADVFDRRAVGSPVLNDYGEVIGLAAGGFLPGAPFAGDVVLFYRNGQLGSPTRGALAVPISMVDEKAGGATAIANLVTNGQFTPALVGNQQILNGTLAREINRKVNPPAPIDERSEFSRADSKAVVFLTWMPKQKRSAIPTLRVFDMDNRMIYENVSKKKVSFSVNTLSYSAWDMELTKLPPGIYRLDVLLDTDTVWRTFFRMVE